MKHFVGVVTLKTLLFLKLLCAPRTHLLLGFNHRNEPLDEGNLSFEYILAGNLSRYKE